MGKMTEGIYPAARNEGLVVRELADEVVVYDLRTHEAHCLNLTAAAIWRHCDGTTSPAGIAKCAGRELASPLGEDVVLAAIEDLRARGLLKAGAGMPTAPFAGRAMSRRTAITRFGLGAAVALPFVTSIISPTAAQAQSAPCEEVGCPVGQTCQGGLCEPDPPPEDE